MTEIQQKDMSDLKEVIGVTMHAVEKAHTLIAMGKPADAYLLLGKVLAADVAAIDWEEVMA